MRSFKQVMLAGLLAMVPGAVLSTGSAQAVPVLQLYVEGATYDTSHESWVFEPLGGDPIRLWVIGNVAGPGGKGTIHDVRISIVYDDPGTPVSIDLTPSTTGGYNGVADPSQSAPANHEQTNSVGDHPEMEGGKSLPNHGVFGAGAEWQEFTLGDFGLTDSPIGDFISDFPSDLVADAGQISVYELAVTGDVSDLHIDAYGYIQGKNGKKHAKFAPFSHDAGTGVNEPFDVPEPATVALFLVGLFGLGGMAWRRKDRLSPAR